LTGEVVSFQRREKFLGNKKMISVGMAQGSEKE
jgi:hypothetical protein